MNTKTTILALILAFLMTACGTTHEIREVKVPVIIPCIDSVPTKPVYPLELAQVGEDIFALTKKALAEIELRKGYEGQLEAAIVACKKPDPVVAVTGATS